MMTTDEVLNKAADLIEKNGWLIGAYGNNGGPHCVLGAIAEAVGLSATDCGTPRLNSKRGRAIVFLAQNLGIKEKKFYNTEAAVVNWNDSSGQTKKKVIASLRLAAAK